MSNFNFDQAERRSRLTLCFGNNSNPTNGTPSYLNQELSRPNSVPIQPSFNTPSFRYRSAPFSGRNELTERSQRLRIGQSINSTGILQVSPEKKYNFSSEHLIDCGEIGRGGFGTVNKMIHKESETAMAVKRIRSTVDEREQKQLLMDLGVVMESNDCPYIVMFYGALFIEVMDPEEAHSKRCESLADYYSKRIHHPELQGDCWICMELMDTSLDKFYKYIYDRLDDQIPEKVIGKISVATVRALNYLKEHLKIIHRDVKPSNILLDRGGNIKLCDFGISGQLVDSIAKSSDAGCRPYMAPERIDPQKTKRGYDVRSDIWSLGITLMEVATGRFPYPKWNSVFEQLYQVVNGRAPSLSPDYQNRFSRDFIDFVDTCLIKEETRRPKYNGLLEHPFIKASEQNHFDTAGYFCYVLDSMAENGVLYSSEHS